MKIEPCFHIFLQDSQPSGNMKLTILHAGTFFFYLKQEHCEVRYDHTVVFSSVKSNVYFTAGSFVV